jgi:hypothetical protein
VADVRNPRHEKLPPEIRDLFKGLWNQVASLHFRWGALTHLFTGDPKRTRMLLDTAPHFFGLVRLSLQDAVVLGVSRLADPARGNLSLEALVIAVEPIAPTALAHRLRGDLARLREVATPMRLRRNRVVAHLDRETLLAKAPDSLPGVAPGEFEAALAAIESLMNTVEQHFTQGETAYGTSLSHGDVDALVHHLEAALRAEDEERLRRGLAPRRGGAA